MLGGPSGRQRIVVRDAYTTISFSEAEPDRERDGAFAAAGV